MRSELWQRVDRLLAAAMELDPEARSAYLARAAEGDTEVEGEVRSLLAADAEAERFLESPGQVLGGLGADGLDDGSVAGRRIGPYRLLRLLGQGGMGTVFLAARDDDEYRQQVALKVLSADRGRAELRSRFRTERQVLANLVHPHIARLYDGGTTDDGRPYLVMEYVEGEPIDAYCDHQRLTIEERLTLFRDVCGAVDFAHRNLVVHRDLKPGNILVGEDGTPRLLDFGIAKLLDAERFGLTAKTTHSGMRPMTPGFASPEQIRGESITTATDVYALGVLLHRLLSGRGPYRRDRGLENAILEQEPVRPSTAVQQLGTTAEMGGPLPKDIAEARRTTLRELQRGLRGDLDTIVLTALRKRPERRYGSAFALAEDLDRYRRSMPLLARPDTAAYRLQKFVRRNTVATGAGVLGALVLLGFSMVTFIQSVRLAEERDVARLERAKAEDVSSFLLQLFEESAPEQSRGEDVTMGEVLDRASSSIAELDDQPGVQGAALATMGRVYAALGRFDDARRLLAEALVLQRRVLGDQHLDVAATLAELAFAHLRKGDYQAAELAGREALAIRRERLSSDDLAIPHSLNNLGLILHNRGRYAEAEPMYREAIATTGRVLGPDASELQDVVGNLSILLHDLGDYEAAEVLYRRSIDLRLRNLGPDHPGLGNSYNNLAVLQHDKGDYEAAAKTYQQAIDLRRSVLGEDHPSLYRTISNYARLHHDQGDLDEAEKLYEQALEKHRVLLGDRHPWVARTIKQLGRLAFDRGDLVLAEQRYRTALEIQRERLGKDHKRVGETLVDLGRLLLAREDRAAAADVLEPAVAIFDQRFAEGHWQRSYAMALLRVSRAQQDDRALVEYLGQTQRALEDRIGPRAPAVRDVKALIKWPRVVGDG